MNDKSILDILEKGMNIVNGLHERITDFENILEATKGKSYNEAFKWRGKNYNSFKIEGTINT